MMSEQLITTAGFIVMIGVPLKVKKKPVCEPVAGIPGVPGFNRLIFAVLSPLADKPVMLNIIDNLKECNSYKGLKEKKKNSNKPKKNGKQHDQYYLFDEKQHQPILQTPDGCS